MARSGLILVIASTALLIFTAYISGILSMIAVPCGGLVAGLAMIQWAIEQPPRPGAKNAEQNNQS